MIKQESGKKVSVNELIEKYFKLKVGLRVTSYRTVRNRVDKWIRPYFGEVYADEIDHELLFEWFGILQENLSSGSVRQVINILREILDVGINYFGLNDNLARRVKFKVKSDKKPMEIWTRSEFELFISKVSDPHYYVFYKTLFNTGMRLGEILGIQFKDVNFKTGALIINKNLQYIEGEMVYQSPKTTKSNRKIYLSDEVLEDLKKYCDSLGSYRKEDRIFYLTPYKYRHYLTMICDFYDLKPIKLHGFRHSFATEMISKGIPVNYVSAWLGHSKISTTLDFYTQETEKGNRVILKFLND